jgi:hypothetical protein
MDLPDCIRCQGTRVVPGGIPGEGIGSFFRVDSSVALTSTSYGPRRADSLGPVIRGHGLSLPQEKWLTIMPSKE